MAEEIPTMRCPRCGRQGVLYVDFYCLQAMRGANHQCKDHMVELICNDCWHKEMIDGKLAPNCPGCENHKALNCAGVEPGQRCPLDGGNI